MKELITLYQIHSPSRKEDNMVNYLVKRLCDIGLIVHADEHQNIYGVLGEADTYPCIVAHMDEVHTKKPDDYEILQFKGNLFGFSNSEKDFVGIGADDKNGIWVALKVAEHFAKKKKPMKVAFFVGEEVGCIGSSRADLTFFDDCRFILQCDRRGGHDFINKANAVDLNSKEFRKVAGEIYKKFGYSDACGTTTDVYELKLRGLGISVANISCGYYNPHTAREMTCISELRNCLKMVLKLMEIKESFPHEYEAPKIATSFFSYPVRTGNYYYNGWRQDSCWYADDPSWNNWALKREATIESKDIIENLETENNLCQNTQLEEQN